MSIKFYFVIQIILTTVLLCSAQDKAALSKHHKDHYHLSMFAGYSTDMAGHSGYKLGLDYEYRLNKNLGIGGTFDFTGKDFRIFSLSFGLSTYPFNYPLILSFGVGAKNKDNKWKPFLRGIIAYDFHFGKISLGPVVMYDIYFSSNDILSPGIGFGISL